MGLGTGDQYMMAVVAGSPPILVDHLSLPLHKA